MVSETYYKEMGERIKARRTEIGMSQQELASKIGFQSKQAVSKIEAGVRKVTTEKAQLIANALDTTVDYIMGFEKLDLIGEINDELKERSEDYLKNLLGILRSDKI